MTQSIAIPDTDIIQRCIITLPYYFPCLFGQKFLPCLSPVPLAPHLEWQNLGCSLPPTLTYPSFSAISVTLLEHQYLGTFHRTLSRSRKTSQVTLRGDPRSDP